MSEEAIAPAESREAPLLRVRDLSVRFDTELGELVALDGVSFEVPRNSTVALIGESGSGKSVTAHAILRLLPSPPARVSGGSVELGGQDLLGLRERHMRAIRGDRIGIVFQDPTAALDPLYSVGAQVAEALRVHDKAGRREARRRAIELLRRVGFPQPEVRHADYPHELSGGMRQRAMIAIALACEPELLIADEPTTALDTLAAAQINALLADLRRETRMSMLLISHDVASVAENADLVVVMYAGQVVERGPAQAVLSAPRHPYTRALLQSVPPLRVHRRRRRETPTRLPAIEGAVPVLLGGAPAGCRFAERCPDVFDRCRGEEVELLHADGGVEARCLLVDEGIVLPLVRPVEPPAAPRPEGEAPDDDDEPDSERAIDAELEEVLEHDSIRAEGKPDEGAT